MDKEVLDRLHKTLVEILLEVDRVCRLHGITYFAVGGTLLGAVVHKDFIPWDDDLDIAMPRRDYDRFLSLAETELGKKKGTVFIEKGRENIKNFPEIYIDIFPFEATQKKNGLTAKLKFSVIRSLDAVIRKRVTKTGFNHAYGYFFSFFFATIRTKISANFRYSLMKSFCGNHPRYYMDIAGGRSLKNSYFIMDKITPVCELSFGDIAIPAPNDPNYYLLELYGERYKIIPPPEERWTHEPLAVSFGDECCK